jgi:hypothetical protein
VPFTAGNIVVYRVGTGTAALNTNASKIFLDEYTTAGVLVQSIEMPSTGQKLTMPGSGASDWESHGLITLSVDGRYVSVPAYNVDLGDDPYNGAMEKTIGLVGFNGSVSSITTLDNPDFFYITSAITNDGTSIWHADGADGIQYCPVGATSSTKINNASRRYFGINIAVGQLYAGGVVNGGVQSIGTGLPITTGQTPTALPGLPSGELVSQFAFADLNPGVPGVDVLYVASQATSVAGGLKKYSLVSGSWVSNGTIGTESDKYHGLTVKVQGNSVTVFATRIGTNSTSVRGGQLVSLTDNSGYNAAITGTPTVLADVATRFGTANFAAFRGVSLVPQGPSVKVSAKIFLQGAYSASFSRHKDVSAAWAAVLNANALTQPYNTAVFGSYAGTESVAASFFASTAGTTDITDWVLVELRDATTPTTVIARRAAFVREDGKVVDLDGTSDVNFPNVNNGNYYIVIRHRNHLGVRSSSAVALSGTATTYDFTTGQAKAFQDGAITNTAMAELSTGTIYGMWGGNSNSNTQTRSSGLNATTNDFLHLVNIALAGNVATIIPSVYSSDDLNMDGTVRASGLNATTNDLLFLWNTVLAGNTATIITQHQ